MYCCITGTNLKELGSREVAMNHQTDCIVMSSRERDTSELVRSSSLVRIIAVLGSAADLHLIMSLLVY